MSEKNQVTDKVKDLIIKRGGKAIKWHGSPMTEVGTPDVLGAFLGVSIAVECKRPRKKPSPIQRRRLIEWGRCGGAVAIKVNAVAQMTAVLDALEPVKGTQALVSGSAVERALCAAEAAGATSWRQLQAQKAP